MEKPKGGSFKVRGSWIIGFFTIVAAIIAGFFALLDNNNDGRSNACENITINAGVNSLICNLGSISFNSANTPTPIDSTENTSVPTSTLGTTSTEIPTTIPSQETTTISEDPPTILTDAPDTTSPTVIPPLVYEEDFEDARADGWSQAQGVTVINDGTGNLVLRMVGTPNITLNPSLDWRDYIVEVQYRAIDWGADGGWNLDFRGTRDICRFYSLWTSETFTGLSRFSTCFSYEGIPNSNEEWFQGNNWHTIRVTVEGSLIRWQYDDRVETIASDDTYETGGIGIFVWGTEEIWFDNIRVWLSGE